jgi:hypothetical protein
MMDITIKLTDNSVHTIDLDGIDVNDYDQQIQKLLYNCDGTTFSQQCSVCGYTEIGCEPSSDDCIECGAVNNVKRTAKVGSYEITDSYDVPKLYRLDKTLCSDFFEYSELVEDGDVSMVNAAIECGIDIAQCEEAFAGYYNSDEEFAKSQHEQTCEDSTVVWPYNCIDWTYAAKELMYDYTSHDDYYFSNI